MDVLRLASFSLQAGPIEIYLIRSGTRPNKVYFDGSCLKTERSQPQNVHRLASFSANIRDRSRSRFQRKSILLTRSFSHAGFGSIGVFQVSDSSEIVRISSGRMPRLRNASIKATR